MLTKPITYAYALFIISSILLILSSPAYAEKIDPDTVAFEDMLAGGFAEETLVFHVDSRDPIPVRLSSAGPIREWIQFNQTRVMASAAAPLRLRLTIKPPDDALLGSHQGMVLIEKYSQGNLAATAVSMFSAVKIEVRIIDKEIVEGEVISTMAADAEQGQPVDITAVIRNNGNIAISPRVQVRISDLSGNLLFNNTIEKEIMPTATGTADLLVPPSNLAPGQYRADVTVSLNNMFLRQESSLFNIFSPNSSRRAGRLLDIQSDMRIPVNATTTIIPYFENIGNEAVSAFFIGDVYVNKKRIRQVTGLPLTVLPGEVRG